jgi:hypothetical protein
VTDDQDTDNQNRVINNGVKLLGEVFITPGTSLLLEGKVGAGLLHGALGLAAIAALGPVLGPLTRILIAGNSYSRSVSDRNLWETIRDERNHDEVDRGERRRSRRASTPPEHGAA